MKVVLMRHGHSVDRMDPHCPPERERPLTEKGVRRSRAAAAGLRSLDVRPDVILTSPLVRAAQTAVLVAQVLGCPDVRTTDTLAGGIRTRDVFELLALLESENVLCVGHAPQLDLLLAAALPHDSPAVGPLKRTGAACVELDVVAPSGGQLAWVLAPKALRKLGRE